MRSTTSATTRLLAALMLAIPFAASAADRNPPSGGLVECTEANGFQPSQQDYQLCAHYFLEHIEELDTDTIALTAASLGSKESFAALIFDAPDSQGQVDLIVTSARRASRMLVARGRWPTETAHDCAVVADAQCSLSRTDPQGRPIHLLVRGDNSPTTVTGYWHRR